MSDVAACRFNRGRDHVTPIGDSRCAKNKHQLRAILQRLRQARLATASSCATRRSTTMDAPASRRPAVTFKVLSITSSEARQQCRNHGHLLYAMAARPERAPISQCAAVSQMLRGGKRDDFHRADHFARDHRRTPLSVAKVSAGSTRLILFTASRSMMRMPVSVANRLARPVEASSAPRPARARLVPAT